MRISVKVDVVPAQGSGLLGAEPGQEAQHNVGVHQYCRAADVFQAGVQLYRRLCLGSLNNCRGLLYREGLRRPPFLALGSVDQGRDVARHKILASACRMVRFSARCPMVTTALE